MTFKRCCLSTVRVSRGFHLRGSVVCLASVLAMAAFAPAAEPKLKPSEEVGGLVASDGLQLAASYWPGPEDRDTVPVILLHMWKGDRKEYAGLAPYLQKQGHAVLVPDLRGHGASTQSRLGGRKLDAAKMGNEHLSFMRYDDMELLRKFLVKKNDEELLNLNKLCIVGAEMGASVAAYYAFYDWTEFRREANRRPAPSRDIKGLFLISPDWDFKGMPMNKPFTHPLVRSQISVMIVAGKEDSKALAESRRLHKLIKRFHADPETVDVDQRDLWFIPLPTKLQGTKILGIKALNLEEAIGTFIKLRAVDQSYPWYRRASKN
ncbi:MAG: alpha/beta fold hydrolase [Planctomycetes bacterium]|nr:alpha/beta fold hydrolase [Planctomycetota bacterium]